MSPIFVVPKSDGTYMYRLIFNFKKCNKAVLFRHFKMDILSTVIGLITLDSYMASLDLTHAYYSIPISTEQRRYLKFVWNGQLYEFGALNYQLPRYAAWKPDPNAVFTDALSRSWKNEYF